MSGRSGSRSRFDGQICGLGSVSGHRLVIGCWALSPFGTFVDVMHERPDGSRRLIAPTSEIARFVSETYVFDEVVVARCSSQRTGDRLLVRAGDISIDAVVGRRTVLGWLLRLVPRRIATAPAWARLIGPVARVVQRGVRTSGSAGGGRWEFYGATDHHAVTSLHGSVGGVDLGALAELWPPVRFGFGSAPRTPSLVDLVTTIRLPAGAS